MDAQFKAERLASGVDELPEVLSSTSYAVISEGSRGFIARPGKSHKLAVKVFTSPSGESECTYEFDTVNYGRHTSAKPVQSLPTIYAQGHLDIGPTLLPAIAMERSSGTTMCDMGHGRLTRDAFPKDRSADELLRFALALANTLHELRAHYIHCGVRTPDTVIIQWDGDGPSRMPPSITFSDVMTVGFSSPTSSGVPQPTLDPLPFTPPELAVPDEEFDWPPADPIDMWVYGSLVCYAAVGRFWDEWMDGRKADSLRSTEFAMARSLKRSALDLRSLAPGHFSVPGTFPTAECVADVVMACTNAEPSLRPDIIAVKSVLEAAAGTRTSTYAPMPFSRQALKRADRAGVGQS
ncbi:MAG: hypothetical protein Q4A07_00455 [Coriobacteriales bacterium]|nr:hypothetical protein [Coriobacteriales bacterium]